MGKRGGDMCDSSQRRALKEDKMDFRKVCERAVINDRALLPWYL